MIRPFFSLSSLVKGAALWLGALLLLSWTGCQNPVWLLGLPCEPGSDCASPQLQCRQGLCVRDGAGGPPELILLESPPENSQPEPSGRPEEITDVFDAGTPERHEHTQEISMIPEIWGDRITGP